MENKSELIAQLIFRHLSGTLTPKDQQELDKWLSASEQNRLFFEEMTNEETLQEEMLTFLLPDQEAQWQDITKKLHTIPQVEPIPTRRLWSNRRFNYAAAAVIIFLTAGVIYILNKPSQTGSAPVIYAAQSDEPIQNAGVTLTLSNGKIVDIDHAAAGLLAQDGSVKWIKEQDAIRCEITGNNTATNNESYNVISTGIGSIYKIELPDGSVTWLSSVSSLKIPGTFNTQDRHAYINGEAYFEVASQPGANSPFTVTTNTMTIEVLGTRFNVTAYNDEPASTTTLLDGAVRVNNGSRSVTLQPGEEAICDTMGRLETQKVANIENATAWMENGSFKFKNAPIELIMRQIKRWYKVPAVTYTAKVKALFRGSIERKNSLRANLDILEATGEVSFKQKNDTLFVTPVTTASSYTR